MPDDLDAFLRQAAQRRARQPQPVPRPAKPFSPPPRPPAPTPAPSSAPPRRPTEPVAATLVPPAPEPPPSAGVGTRVDTTSFDRRAEHLGEDIGQADQQMASHLTQTLEERAALRDDLAVGSLDTPTVERPLLHLEELVAMLRDPSRLPYAIALSEVLPPLRW